MRLRHRLAVLLVPLAAALLTACGDDDTDTTTSGASSAASTPAALDGKTFSSTEVTGHTLVPDSTVRLSFEADRISADAGCNTLNGAASWDTGVLEVPGPLASTRKACPDDLQAQDVWLDGFLTSSPALVLEGDTLTLDADTEGMTLEASS